MAEHVCPWWIGYLLASPIRRWLQDPDAILAPHLHPGMTALDVGCAMGFFTLPMARRVGEQGRVIAVDLQPRMLAGLTRRAARAGVAERIEARACGADGLGIGELDGQVDFALAFAMVHEVPDPARLFAELFAALVPGGALLVSEPAGHVGEAAFEASVTLAREAGFAEIERPQVRRGRTVLLRKPAGGADGR